LWPNALITMSAEKERRLRRAVAQAQKAETAYSEARQKLRDEIKEARGSGMTLDSIAEIVGVTRQRILQLLK
jgi:RecA/RadA recombinase